MARTITADAQLKPTTVRALYRHYLFAPLSAAQWLRLERRIHLHRLAAGGQLFCQGEPATAFFIVCSGTIKLFRGSPQGQEKIMRLVRAGQSFAESTLFFSPRRYPVHAQAVAGSTLAAIDCETYLSLLRDSFDTCRAVMAQMVERIYAHWDEIEVLSLYDSRARVARYLLGLHAERGGAADGALHLPGRRTLVAAQLGLAPETLSRALHALRASGLIDVHGMIVDIRDVGALCRHAQW